VSPTIWLEAACTFFAAIAAVAAVVSVIRAGKTVEASETTIAEARESRKEAECEWKRHRIVRVAELSGRILRHYALYSIRTFAVHLSYASDRIRQGFDGRTGRIWSWPRCSGDCHAGRV
jgi:hypothetical protein